MHFLAKDRIRHFVAGHPTSVVECLTTHFRLPPERTAELLALGSIYRDHRRVFADEKVAKGEYLRIHLQPKRFSLEGIDWSKVLVKDTRDYLICAKPFGIPAHPTVDNQQENLLHQMRLHTGYSLLVTQRLDVPVGGLMVLGKNADFQRRFNRWLSEGKILKRYKALVPRDRAPSVGRKVHYMKPSERSPREVCADPREGWQVCELSVLACLPRGETQPEVAEVEIDLHTGRTHQIRAQLSSLGSPVLGDRLYGSRLPYSAACSREAIALYSYSVGWTDRSGPVKAEIAPAWNDTL